MLVLNNLNYVEKASDKKQATKASDKKQATKTKENKNKIIDYIKNHGESTTRELAEFIGLSQSRTRAILKGMGEIKPVGERRGRVYRLK